MAWVDGHWPTGLMKPGVSRFGWLVLAGSVVWTLCAAWAFFRVLRRPDYLPDRPGAIRLFSIAQVVSAAWAWLSFAGRHPNLALGVAALLAVTAALTVRRFAVVDGRAGLLLVPWLAATVMALLMDLSIVLKNG